MNTITLPAGWTTRHFSERDGGRFTIGIYNSEKACVGTYRFAGFTVEHQHRNIREHGAGRYGGILEARSRPPETAVDQLVFHR